MIIEEFYTACAWIITNIDIEIHQTAKWMPYFQKYEPSNMLI